MMTLLFFVEEHDAWRFYERFPQLPLNSRLTPEEDSFTWGMALERRPSLAEKTYAAAEVPVYLLLGEYGNAPFQRPLISPHDWPVIRTWRTVHRVPFVDALKLFLIGTLWWTIGKLIDRRIQFHRQMRSLAIIISICGAVMLSLSAFAKQLQFRFVDIPVLSCMTLSLLCWLAVAVILARLLISRLFANRPAKI
jgi:hypothetical protein